jgi:hypothetical protein
MRTVNKKPLWTRNVLRAATLHFFDDNDSDGEDPNKIETDAEGYVIDKSKINNTENKDNETFIIGSNNDKNSIINNDSNNNNNKSYKSYSNNINKNKDNDNNGSNKDNDDSNDGSNHDGNDNKYVTRTSGHVASTSNASWAFLSAKDKKLLPHRKEGESTTCNVVAARQALSFAADLPRKQAITAVSAIIATTTTTTTTTITTGSISSKNKTSRSLRNATSAAIDANFDFGDEGYELYLIPLEYNVVKNFMTPKHGYDIELTVVCPSQGQR